MSAPANSHLSSNPESHGHVLQNVSIAFIVLDILFVSLRILARFKKGQKPRADEYLIIPALLFNVGLAIEAILMYQHANVGRHLLWIRKHEPLTLATFAKLQVAFEFTYVLGFTFPKLAILCLFLHIFVEVSHRRATYSLIGIVSAICAAEVIAIGLQCTPLSFVWDKKSHPNGHCVDTNSLWRWGTLPNLIVDFAMFLLPLPCLWKLHLSLKERIGLVLTFLTGSIGIITCVIRMVVLFHTDGTTDATWEAVTLGSLTMLEASTYLFAACLPLYRPLLSAAAKRINETISGTRTGGTHGSKTNNDSELLSIRKPAFADNQFQRLDDRSRQTVVSSTNHTFVDRGYKEASSIESGMEETCQPGIQVKTDIMTLESRR
ncbi:hypothetical protein BJ875DRAFT_514013 [Amylocarpus encephaloides]|uniref:Rhodopsin domain-containing protein n=1 Tax=Amylocarpus encephaloides TaxID=45428 RepID=A0A9P7YRU9_9HELO|nr:hypothetical protein BJ875DRAFT_514013 [Amylocarpus encephaloides]